MPLTGGERVLLAWSSGKDSAYALHVLRERGIGVAGLLTTLADDLDRVPLHEVRLELVRAQAQAVGLPLIEVRIPSRCPAGAYEKEMARALAAARSQGVTAVAFGDLFLEDVRRYREERMSGTGLRSMFPLWGRPTRALAEEMLASGQKAVLTCVDTRVLPRELAGRAFDASLLRDLPRGVDPCGENGEFHTLAWDGPAFRRAVPIRVGAVSARDGFAFADVMPAGGACAAGTGTP